MSRTTIADRRSLPILLAAAALTAACAAPSTTAEPAAPAAGGTFPVTVEHAYGSTEIPREPTRVLTLGLSDQDPLLALGVAPVAVYPWYGDYEFATWPWAQDELGDARPTVLAGGVRDRFGEIAVSDELMGELSRDLLVWNVGFAPEERAAVENNPVYPTLPAVEDGRVLWIEDPVVSGAFSWGTVLSLDFALRQLVPQIAETVG